MSAHGFCWPLCRQHTVRRLYCSTCTGRVTELNSFLLQGLAGLMGQQHRLQLLDDPADYDAALSEDVAVVMLTQVSYRSGRLLDMRSMTRAAHAK